MNSDVGDITDEQIIADKFNMHFVEKINNLKSKIDQEYVSDPLEKLEKKLKNKSLKFDLKRVTEKSLKEAFKKIKKKKSSGCDGVSQEHLAMGSEELLTPLLAIFNKSITSGVFPEKCKEAIVTPVHKKGDKSQYENYRPVSCLPAAAKLLELIIHDQVSEFMEGNGFIPETQHGFRKKRSTMTAWAQIQQDWALNTEEKKVTGVLMWDLSAAFDTLDHNILCNKLEIYGFTKNAVKWMRSYLSGRTQRVKIGNKLSDITNLSSGVPQGGNFSPLAFVIYVSDLEDWLEFARSLTYADDTSTGVSAISMEEVIKKLEIDAVNVLKFMASNGLVANASKTTLIFLNAKLKTNDFDQEKIKIKVGKDWVTQERNAKLLGMTIDDNQIWRTQIYEKGGLLTSLNSRIFIVRRLQSQIGNKNLKKIMDSLYTSKLRYCLPLLGKIRWSNDDVYTKEFGDIQKNQNKMMTFFNKTKISDKISTISILEKHNQLSVNQLNAQMKLCEMWKANNLLNYPTKVHKRSVNEDSRSTTRSATMGVLLESGKTYLSQQTAINDAIYAWNRAPGSIKNCVSLTSAKKAIREFAKTLPV